MGGSCVFWGMLYDGGMARITFDTHSLIARLREAGIEEKQAEAIVEGIQEINLEGVATKSDIAELKQEITNLKVDMLKWIVPLLIGQVALFVALVELFIK